MFESWGGCHSFLDLCRRHYTCWRPDCVGGSFKSGSNFRNISSKPGMCVVVVVAVAVAVSVADVAADVGAGGVQN